MTLENTNFGSKYGIEIRSLGTSNWAPINRPTDGFETYEEAYQAATKFDKLFGLSSSVPQSEKRCCVVVYNYDGSNRKNVRVLTII